MDYYQEATTLLSVLQEFLMFSLKIIQITKVSKRRYFCGFALLTYLSLYTIKFKDVSWNLYLNILGFFIEKWTPSIEKWSPIPKNDS